MLDNSGRSDQMNKKMEHFHNVCRQTGMRITPQRTTIYKALIESKEHPSADMLCRKIRKSFPNISLDTVNRTLITLSKIGAAYVVEGSGDPKRFEGNLNAHQHFKCLKCRKIFDFHHKPFDKISVPAQISKKFTVLRKTVYFEGLCDKCQ